jgi:hypothetical chaperone protein
MASHCGLDFGTSNSTLATAVDGPARLLALEDGRPTIPSVMFFRFEDGQPLFGRAALAEYLAGTDGRMMRSLKSVLGSALFAERTRVGRRLLPFGEILATFVGHLKAVADANAGRAFDSVVAGRPVRFVDDDDAADAEAERQLVRAVKSVGFSHVETQFEPIAAAFDHESRLAGERLALVADLGGGTSDFTVIRLSPERARASDRKTDILSTVGVHVGGNDFDRRLSLALVMPQLGQGTPTADGKRLLPQAPYYDLSTWHRINRLYTREALAELRQTRREAALPERVELMVEIVEDRQGHGLLAAVEAAKIALSDQPETAFRFDVRENAISDIFTEAAFAEAIDEQVVRIGAAIDEALRRAVVPAAGIDTLILTGGSTKVPRVDALLQHRFPHAEVARTDPFGSVGLGLALDARRRFG